MRQLLIIAGVLIAVSGIAAQDKEKITHGEKVYVAQKCIVCHSIEGKGNKKGPLDGVGTRLSQDEIRQWIVNAAEMTKKTQTEASRR